MGVCKFCRDGFSSCQISSALPARVSVHRICMCAKRGLWGCLSLIPKGLANPTCKVVVVDSTYCITAVVMLLTCQLRQKTPDVGLHFNADRVQGLTDPKRNDRSMNTFQTALDCITEVCRLSENGRYMNAYSMASLHCLTQRFVDPRQQQIQQRISVTLSCTTAAACRSHTEPDEVTWATNRHAQLLLRCVL